MENPLGTHENKASRDQLKALLTLAEGEGNPKLLAETLRHPGVLEALLTDVCEGQEASGEILLQTVCDEATPLEALRGIKELAKRLRTRAHTDEHREATNVLYHLTIAAAFGIHGESISARPVDKRMALYENLATTLKDTPPGEVFQAAIDRVASLKDPIP